MIELKLFKLLENVICKADSANSLQKYMKNLYQTSD